MFSGQDGRSLSAQSGNRTSSISFQMRKSQILNDYNAVTTIIYIYIDILIY